MLASERRGIHQMSLAPWDALSMCPRWCAPGQAVWGGQDSPKEGVAAGSPAFSWTPSLWGLGLEVKGNVGMLFCRLQPRHCLFDRSLLWGGPDEVWHMEL